MLMNLDLISLWTHTLVQEVGSVYTRLDYIGVQLKVKLILNVFFFFFALRLETLQFHLLVYLCCEA